MRWIPGSLRARILLLILLAALLPVVLLSAILVRETRELMTLWQPTRLGRSMAFSLEAQRALLEAQGRIQGELALRLLRTGGGVEVSEEVLVERVPATGGGPRSPEGGGRSSLEGSAEGISPGGGEHIPEPGEETTMWQAVSDRLPVGPPGAAGPEPPFRVLTVRRSDDDLLVAAARTTEVWVLVGRVFPLGTFQRLEDLSRDLSFLNRLEDVSAVAGTALGFLVVLVAVVAAVAAVILGTLLARSVTRPVERLAHAMTRLGEGDELPNVAPQGAREVRVLSETFNRLGDQLHQARARLAATERSLGFRDSARQVAHEMKNALTPILSALGVLRPSLEDADERPRRALRLLEGEAARLEKLAAGFSQMARLPAPDPKPVDAMGSLRRILNLHLPQSVAHEDAGLFADADMRASIEGPVLVLADPDALDQVWVNLVRNAVEAMPEGGKLTLAGWIEAGGAGGSVLHMALTDTGPGPPDGKEMSHFHPGTTTKAEGSGLGLYTSQLLLRVAGGDLVLEPADGGARAHVTLPVLESAVSETGHPERGVSKARRSGPGTSGADGSAENLAASHGVSRAARSGGAAKTVGTDGASSAHHTDEGDA